MTAAEQLAAFVVRASYGGMSENGRHQLKIRILDALGCAIGALEGAPIRLVRAHLDEFGGAPRCTLIGGGAAPPDRAAFYNAALVRYLDFNDSYVAPGESCHPSDNLGPVLAAAEDAGASGRDLLAALAVAYQVQCRLSDVAPVRAKGFDHTTQGSYAVAAGVSRALGLDAVRTANALAISGTALNALRVTRTGPLSHWKGLAYPHTAFGGTHAAYLAARGITGPPLVFEGNKGFMDAIAGRFEIDWSAEDLERVALTGVKKYNAEYHSQPTLEGILALRADHDLRGEDVQSIEIDTFDVAFHIIGGGEEGDKTIVRTKEEADHSLHYMAAVALLDGEVMPQQYAPERILREDVQSLLRRVTVRPAAEFTRRFPQHMACRISLKTRDGRVLVKEQEDFEGFPTQPMRWETVAAKFERLGAARSGGPLQRQIVAAVAELERISVRDLTTLLAQVGRG
ncbi:MAG: MmgE/PrpD family protein [bacterium]